MYLFIREDALDDLRAAAYPTVTVERSRDALVAQSRSLPGQGAARASALIASAERQDMPERDERPRVRQR